MIKRMRLALEMYGDRDACFNALHELECAVSCLASAMLVVLVLLREESVLQTPGLHVLHRVSTGSVVINAMLPRRHCLEAHQEQIGEEESLVDAWIRQK